MTGNNNLHGLAAAWFEEFEPLIRQALSTRARGRADIDDLAQEVYLRMLRIPQPDLVANPQAYLYRVAINVAEEWRQRAAQALVHSSDPLADLAATHNPERDAGYTEREEVVQQALVQLPNTILTAVILHTRDGMTYDEIAEHMGVKRRAVKRYIANGYAKLREHLTTVAPAQTHGGKRNNRLPTSTPEERQ